MLEKVKAILKDKDVHYAIVVSALCSAAVIYSHKKGYEEAVDFCYRGTRNITAKMAALDPEWAERGMELMDQIN